MISQKAINTFLARKLNSYDWLKKEPAKHIKRETKHLPSSTWLHQRVCYLILEYLKRFMLFVDMGGGKTFVCLSLIHERKLRGENPKAIVFVPFITSVSTWIDETEKHTPGLTCVPLLGTRDGNLQALEESQGDLFVICYQSAVAMLAQPHPMKKGRWTIDPALVRELFKPCDMLIMDEIHRCKSQKSLTYRMCRAISAQVEYAVGLTGTPFGRDLQDLWPQFYLLDFGETLGPNLGFYRGVFFNEYNILRATKYSFKKRLFKDLRRIIKHRSIRFSIDELHDLPPKMSIRSKIRPHSAISTYAEKSIALIRAMQIQKSGTYNTLKSEYTKLRQLASGFMTLHGTDDDKVHVAFDENPKLDTLEELIDEMPWGCKMVVFQHFRYTNKLICDRLKRMKVGHASIYGGSKDQLGQLRKFRNNDKCRVLVINSRSGSTSLNLQHANYVVFFEQPDSPIDRQQAERRVWRPGQAKRVFIYDLLMKETVDWAIYGSNKVGQNLLQSLLDGKVEL